MALTLVDRVNETTTTAGTGTLTLAGAVNGYQSFSAVGNGNTTYYTIAHQTANEWEVGIGTYTSAGTTLSRDTVLASSNSGSLVNFSAGTKNVFCDYPAGKAVYQDASGNVGIGTASPGAKLDIASGTQTTSVPIINGTQTWNAAGTTFTALKTNVTDTASAAASLLMDLQVGGASKFQVAKSGNITNALNTDWTINSGGGGTGGQLILSAGGGYAQLTLKGGSGNAVVVGLDNVRRAAIGATGLQLVSGAYISWSSNSAGPADTSQDLFLYRDAANTFAQRNGTTAQTKRVYNTYTDASNYERGVFDWGTTANLLSIGTQNAGTGSARDVAFLTGSTERARILSTGNFGVNTIFPSYQEEVNGSFAANGNSVLKQIYNAGGNNLLTYSEQFDNAAWNWNTGVTLTANNITAPDGSLTGYKMLIDTSNGRHYVGRTTTAIPANSTYVSSVYVKAGTATKVGIAPAVSYTSPYNYTNAVIAVFDLSTGSLVYVGASANSTTTTITAVGNGWYRISVNTVTASVGGGNIFNVVLVDQTTPTTYSYTGNGTDYVYIWGAQEEAGSIPSSYTKVTSSAATTANVIYHGAGTAAAPSLTFNANTSTGLFQPTSNVIGFSTAGAEKMRLDSSGNLALGLSSPTAKFDISAGTQTTNLPIINGTQTWNGATVATTGASGTGTTATITFATQASAYPVGSTIVVAGVTPTGYNGTYVVTASSTTSVSYANTTTGAQTVAGTVQQSFTAIKTNVTDTASAATSLLLDLQVGGVSKFNVDKSANVGIGTSTPASKLNVVAGNSSQGIIVTGGTSGNDINSGGILQLGPDPYYHGRFVYSYDNKLLTIDGGDVTGNIAFKTSFNERMRLDASGNLLINTTSAVTGSKLVVASADATIYGVTVGRGGGAISSNTVLGANALTNNSTGSSNSAFGYNSLVNNTSGNYNNAFGYLSLTSNTTATYNNAFGYLALQYNTTGSNNNGFGYGALNVNTTASGNSAFGHLAAAASTTGVATFGTITGGSGYTNGTYNGVQLTYSSGSTAATYPTANITVSGGAVTAVTLVTAGTRFVDTTTVLTAPAASIGGTGSGFTVSVATLQSATGIVAVGYQALQNNTVGINNTAVGYQALSANTTAPRNTAVGYFALNANTTGDSNTAVGNQALASNGVGTNNSAFGHQALYANTSGFNSAFGATALKLNTTGNNNDAFGNGALSANTTGSSNKSFGTNSLLRNTTGSSNHAFGDYALNSNVSGGSNAAFGGGALGDNTTASNNCAFGIQAANVSTTGVATFGTITGGSGYTNGTYNNVQLTYSSGTAAGVYPTANITVSGGAVTAVTLVTAGRRFVDTTTVLSAAAASIGGTGSGFTVAVSTLQSATGIVAVGYQALQNNTVGTNNSALGYQALYAATGGSNTAIGYNSGNAITTGSKNSILGSYTGNQGGLDIRTASNYIVLSDGDGNPRWIVDNNGTAGYGPTTGGMVTQATSRTTGVTLNKPTGAITLVSAAGTAIWQSFTVTNSTVAATDTIHVVQKSGADLYQIFVTNVAAGSFQITFATTGGITTEQPVFNFAVIKGQTA